jgi:hypothetical protein
MYYLLFTLEIPGKLSAIFLVNLANLVFIDHLVMRFAIPTCFLSRNLKAAL